MENMEDEMENTMKHDMATGAMWGLCCVMRGAPTISTYITRYDSPAQVGAVISSILLS